MVGWGNGNSQDVGDAVMPRIANLKEKYATLWYDTYILGVNHSLEKRTILFQKARKDLSLSNIEVPGQFSNDMAFCTLGWRFTGEGSDKMWAAVRRSLIMTFIVGDRPMITMPATTELYHLPNPLVIPIRQNAGMVLEWHGNTGDFEYFRDSEEFKCVRVEIHGIKLRDVK